MKRLLFLILLIPLGIFLYNWSFDSPWLTDFEEAKKEAKNSGKPILLYFSGSDWCGICIKMKRDMLEKEEFIEYSEDSLVLMLADFPRMKKNRLDEKTTRQNEFLAEKYNPSGGFPYTVLINSEGQVLKEWKGYPNVTVDVFMEQIKKCSKPH